MTDKAKIITIYVSAALVSASVLSLAFWIRGNRVEPVIEPYYSSSSELKPLLTLEKDITLTNQDGEEVKISDLKGKVWAFAQFYAACPMCAKNNEQGVKSLYQKFKDRPDFQMVCITIDPERDHTEQLKSYAEALDADTSNWWFLTGEPEALKAYMVDEMKYDPIQERKDASEAAEKGALAHNMSIAVFDRSLSLIGRRDLFHAKLEGEAVYEETEKALFQMVDTVLQKK